MGNYCNGIKPTTISLDILKCVVTIIIITASKNKYNEMNVVNTRTNILIFMVVTQEPTIENASCYSWVVTHVSHISWKHSSLKRHHQSKLKFRCQRFFKRSMHGCMRTCNTLSWGEMLSRRNVPFSSTLSSTIPHISLSINLLTYHFHTYMWVSPYYFHFIHFSIKSEFMIKY